MLNTLASMERFKIRVGEKWNFKARKKPVNNLKKRVGVHTLQLIPFLI